MAESYEKAGVNLEAGYEVVRRIKKHVASTARTGVMVRSAPSAACSIWRPSESRSRCS